MGGVLQGLTSRWALGGLVVWRTHPLAEAWAHLLAEAWAHLLVGVWAHLLAGV